MKNRLKKVLGIMTAVIMTGTVFTSCGSTPPAASNAPASKAPVASTTATKSEAPAASKTPAKPAFPANVSLKVWASDQDQEMLKTLIGNFEKQYPDTKWDINTAVQGADKAKDAALQDLSAAADVFDIPGDQLGALVDAGAVYPNTLYANNIKTNDQPLALEAASYNGKVYGYPYSADTYFLYYDKSVYSADDVKSLDTMLAKSEKAGVQKMGWDMGNAYFSIALMFSNSDKTPLFPGGDAKTVTFNDANGLAAAKYISTLKSKGLVNMTDDSAKTQFSAKKLGAYVSGTWLSDNVKQSLGDNYGVTKLPTAKIDGKDCQLNSFGGAKLYVVKSAVKKENALAAMALADFLTNEQSQLTHFKMTGAVPINTKAAADPAVTKDVTVAALSAQLPYLIVMPKNKEMSNFWTPFGAFTSDVYTGVIKPDKLQPALDTLCDNIKNGTGQTPAKK